jgi:myosin heavy subunit
VIFDRAPTTEIPLTTADLLPFSDVGHTGVDDLVKLEFLNEAEVAECLRARHAQRQIYTYVGRILVSVNPFEPLGV